jgi:DNA segregation ATPase FtsK/SpoIIIE, S-DNA-T family
MIEYLVFPAALAIAATIPKGNDDKKKISTIFKNTGYGIRDKEGKLKTPKFKKKYPIREGEKVIGTRYTYSIPLGLPATKMAKLEKEIRVFSDGLRKPVEVKFDKTLNIYVYDKDIPKRFLYDEIPEQPAKWVVPLGRAVEGMVWHNFDHVPHMTVAGTTRFGKTVMLRMMMTYLIEQNPENVEFYIIDLKGGLEFGRYECLKQVKAVASNPGEAEELLSFLHEQMSYDYVHFRQNHFANIVDTPIKRRQFVIIDEAAQLAPEKWMHKNMKGQLGKCQWHLGEIARIGGALGYREIFATQYPTADTLPRSIKQNADAKISFRLPSGYASGVAIDDYGAEELPSDVKGRALFKTHELRELQVPYITHDEMWEKLERYQEPRLMEGEYSNVINSEPTEASEAGKDSKQTSDAEVRNTGTTTELVRFGE